MSTKLKRTGAIVERLYTEGKKFILDTHKLPIICRRDKRNINDTYINNLVLRKLKYTLAVDWYDWKEGDRRTTVEDEKKEVSVKKSPSSAFSSYTYRSFEVVVSALSDLRSRRKFFGLLSSKGSDLKHYPEWLIDFVNNEIPKKSKDEWLALKIKTGREYQNSIFQIMMSKETKMSKKGLSSDNRVSTVQGLTVIYSMKLRTMK